MTTADWVFAVVFLGFFVQTLAAGVGWLKIRIIESVRRNDAIDELLYDEDE